MLKGLILLLLGCSLLGCQTSLIRDFQNVKVGMDKDDVLKVMGSPNKNQRWNGLDRWTYVLWEDNKDHRKEVHFSEGKAIYVGDVVLPEISAEEQDRLNAESNAKLEQQMAAKRQDTRQQFNVYESSTKATEAVRPVPQYRPVQ